MNIIELIEEEYDKSFIKEQILIENRVSDHFDMRLGQRVFCDPDHMCYYASITNLPESTKNEIIKNIKFLENIEYIPKKTMSVILYEFPENHYAKYHDYKKTKQDHIRKGDMLWVVMCDKELVTIILSGYEIPSNTYVKIHINDLKEYMSNKKRNVITEEDVDKIKHPEKYKEKQKKNDNIKTIKINGVNWNIDKQNEKIYKKNKPNKQYNVYNFIEQIEEKDKELADNILSILV